MNQLSREQLTNLYGPEIVAQCCCYWKLHWANGTWGKCGLCRVKPQYVKLTWDEVDQIQPNQ